MKKFYKPGFVGIVLLVFLTACGPSAEEKAATETKDAANLAKTQTAAAPTPTFTPTPVPTNTATPLPTPTPTPTTRPSNIDSKLGTVERDITYCRIGEVDLKMDIYYPKIYNGPWPVVVYIHGGGWTGGDKQGGKGFMFVDNLVAADYLVVSINYRLAPDYKWPAMIEDVKCAIRSLRANAADFHLDPNRIGVYGTSAGGYLAAFLGTFDAGSVFDTKGGYLNQSSRVQAVVVMFGPIDIRYVCQEKPKYGEGLFGKCVCNDQALLVAFSPMSYASPDDPPFMLVHGDRDTTVPFQQSQDFYDHLNKEGIPVFLVEVRNCGHCFTPMGGEIKPTLEEITQMMIAFFDITLK